MLLQNNLVFLI